MKKVLVNHCSAADSTQQMYLDKKACDLIAKYKAGEILKDQIEYEVRELDPSDQGYFRSRLNYYRNMLKT